MYSHHCCNLARSPTTLISTISREPLSFCHVFCSKSVDSYSFVFLLRPRKFSNAPHLLSPEHSDGAGRSRGGKALPWIASYSGRGEKRQFGKKNGVRSNSSSWEESADSYSLRIGGRKLRDEREDGNERTNLGIGEPDKKISPMVSSQFKQKSGVRSNSSSWEESADNYSLRNGGRKLRDEKEDGNERPNLGIAEPDKKFSPMVPSEDEVAEPNDEPRWYRIKSKYKEFTDTRPRFENPEIFRWNKQESWGKRTWQQAEESSVPKMVGEGVYGVGPVLAALTVARREFYALYVQQGLDLSGGNRKKKDKKGVEKILNIANAIGLKIIEASKHDLNMAVESRPHQGLVLDASSLEMVPIKELDPPAKSDLRSPIWIALDEVTDPQNLGAITRSAYFFGAQGIVLCAKNSAPLSGVVSKASAGSLELIELRSCRNMMKFLTSSMNNGWRVLGGSVSSSALSLHEVEAGLPTILVLGSEGTGLRPLVEISCTQLIRIPGSVTKGDTESEVEEKGLNCFGQELNSFLAVESLNVSVAAGVLLYHLVGGDKKISMEKVNRTSC